MASQTIRVDVPCDHCGSVTTVEIEVTTVPTRPKRTRRQPEIGFPVEE